MKKIIALVLTVVLCAAVSGCGGKQNDDYDSTVAATVTTTGLYADHPHLQGFYGEWNYEGERPDDFPFTKLEVNQDGTCLVDGKAGTWRIAEMTNDASLAVDILIDGEVIATPVTSEWNDQLTLYFIDLGVAPAEHWINKEGAAAAAAALMNRVADEWGSDLFGQWEVFHRDDVGKIEPVVICEDGTLQIGDQSYQWQVHENWYESDTELKIVLLDNTAMLYEMTIWRENGDLHGQLKDTNNEYIILYKPSYYEILTITVDNIYDYFEMVNTWEEERNGFNEVVGVYMWSEFVLKEPYASRVSYVNHRAGVEPVVDRGAIEWRYQQGSFDVLLNDDHTFTLENCVSKLEKTEVSGGSGFTRSSYRFEVPRTSGWYKPGQDLDVEQWRAYTEDGYFGFEVVRVQLNLYLIPESQ